jgi:hypothetical protein
MIGGGRKFEKSQKSKFKKNEDRETFKQFRNKHNDKALYRMLRREQKDVS